jgi:hypothetical protein
MNTLKDQKHHHHHHEGHHHHHKNKYEGMNEQQIIAYKYKRDVERQRRKLFGKQTNKPKFETSYNTMAF